jgi:1-deoxy-D-xylulose-5-phosphate synthase
MEGLLGNIQLPEQIRHLKPDELTQLAKEVRELIINTVSRNGGHLSSNLGVVELTLALLIEFDFCRDQIIFDVGHQVYAWKILTGRLEEFCTLRKLGGISGFPKKQESAYDFFDTGHSSTSISAALGLSRAMRRNGQPGHVIALIGDGALTGGMAFEALNDAGQSGEDLIVILNDNQMSISRNVGGLSRHLENLRVSSGYMRIKSRLDSLLQRIPLIGKPLYHSLNFFKRIARWAVQRQGVLFEQLGFRYYGPIDGHDIPGLLHHLKAIQELHGPVLLHILTQKGRGYRYAEESPDIYHGVAPFIIENGVANGTAKQNDATTSACPISFSAAFGSHLVQMAAQDRKICAISAAMTGGTGLAEFAQTYPDRFFDVGIAEQHAVTLAAGLAAGGLRPVVALYSTFLQRAYDQLLHDICLQKLPVVIAVDRSGIIGEDGETHQGVYDLGLLLPLPEIEVFCPPDYASLAKVMDYALSASGPVAIRYPRGHEPEQRLPPPLNHGGPVGQPDDPDVKQIQILRKGDHLTIAALGTMIEAALQAADILAAEQIQAEVLLISCAKPLDLPALVRSVRKTGHLITVEEALVSGGLGQAMLPDLLQEVPGLRFRLAGLPGQPIGQGNRRQLLAIYGLNPTSIADAGRHLVRPDLA